MRGREKAPEVGGLPVGLSIIRPTDIVVVALWVLALALCVVVYVWGIFSELYLFALPFCAAGLACLVCSRNYVSLVILAAILAVTWYLTWGSYEYVVIYVVAYICFGSIGVAAMVDAIQRAVYYHVLAHIRYVNVKEHPSFKDRITAFVFSVPHDIDTRNITADLAIRGRKFPWKDFASVIWLSMVAGMFFWIYMSFNPSFVNLSDTGRYTVTASGLLVFTVLLYIPLIVMPFSIFASTNVRIVTSYRDFKIYGGAVSTIQRMAVPVAAALMFVLLAVASSNDWVAVLVFIGISAVMLFIIVLVTTVIYFYGMEASTVTSISRKWKLFMPVPLLVGLKERETGEEEFPGTPARDEKDYSKVEIRSRGRGAQ